MKTQRFLEASKKGDLETVQLLLSSKKIDINMKDILNQKHS